MLEAPRVEHLRFGLAGLRPETSNYPGINHSYLSQEALDLGLFSQVVDVQISKIVPHEQPDPERVFEPLDFSHGYDGPPLCVSLVNIDTGEVVSPKDITQEMLTSDLYMILLHDGANRLGEMIAMAGVAVRKGDIDSIDDVVAPVQFVDFFDPRVCLDTYRGSRVSKEDVVQAGLTQNLVEAKQTAHTLRTEIDRETGILGIDVNANLVAPVVWAQPNVVRPLKKLGFRSFQPIHPKVEKG